MSLRTRIALFYCLTMSIIIFSLTFTAQRIMVSSLRTDLDYNLKLRARAITTLLGSVPSQGLYTHTEIIQRFAEEELPTISLLIRVVDLDDAVMAQFGNIPQSLKPDLDFEMDQEGTDKGRFGTIMIQGADGMRVYTVKVFDPMVKDQLAMVQIADSLASVNRAEDRLLMYTLTEGIIATLIALVIGLFVLQRGFRPLDRILRKVEEVGDTNLDTLLADEPRPPELQHLADSLNNMWLRLNKALKAKEAFVAGISHDLRTPLTAIQGQVDVLLMQSSLQPEVKQSLERMKKETRRLVRMTNNLLLNAQLDSRSPFSPQQISLRELLAEVLREMNILADGLSLKLTPGEEVFAYGDYDLLKQAVLNLVDNAIKFTPLGGRVWMSVSNDKSETVIEVSDNGQGIPPEVLPHIMEPFYKAGTSRIHGGAGLGLAIVKQVIELHGGRVQVESQVGTGTIVRLHLPSQTSRGQIKERNSQ
jgi:two-component system, OmpR family, sensor kinase